MIQSGKIDEFSLTLVNWFRYPVKDIVSAINIRRGGYENLYYENYFIETSKDEEDEGNKQQLKKHDKYIEL